MRVIRRAQRERRVLARPVEQHLGAHQRAAVHPRQPQPGDAVRDGAGVEAQPLPPTQRREHGVGQVSDAAFEHCAVGDEGRRVARHGALELADAVGQGDGRARRFDEQGEVGPREQRLGVRPRHAVIDFPDDHPRGPQRRRQVLDPQPQAVLAPRVRGRDLEQHHIGADAFLPYQGTELRIGGGQDVEHARIGQLAVGPRPTVRRQAQVVGMRGLQEAGVARAHKHARAGKRLALAHHRFDQRLRLGAGLAP